jgi:hypothetical protein
MAMGLIDLLDKAATVTLAGGISPAGTSPCTIAPADYRTVSECAQQGITAAYLVYSATDLGVAAGDQLTIAGKSYPVVAVRSFANSAIGPPVFVTVCGPPTDPARTTRRKPMGLSRLTWTCDKRLERAQKTLDS